MIIEVNRETANGPDFSRDESNKCPIPDIPEIH